MCQNIKIIFNKHNEDENTNMGIFGFRINRTSVSDLVAFPLLYSLLFFFFFKSGVFCKEQLRVAELN